jgi:hypothetical protein
MRVKLAYLIVAAMLLPKFNLYAQESVCELFSHLAPQMDGRQLTLMGDLIISNGIAVLGSSGCDNQNISEHRVWPIAVLLHPSEKLSASERQNFEKAATKLDTLRSEGKVVSATATISGKIKVAPKGWLPAELVFDSSENFSVNVLPDPASLPVIPICGLFKNLRAYEGKRIAVRGELATTMEGRWIVGRCHGAFVTDGYRWPVALNFGRPALCSEETTKFCDAQWPSKWPQNTEYMVGGYSDGATTATFVGRLRMRPEYHAVCTSGGWYSSNGFGHLNGAVAELSVENILNAEATPTRSKNETTSRDSDRCVPSK